MVGGGYFYGNCALNMHSFTFQNRRRSTLCRLRQRHPKVIKGFRALDPDIAMLASEAAIDIDNMLLHGSKELKAMRRLAERLE